MNRSRVEAAPPIGAPSILSFLSSDRQRALIEEALGPLARALISEHSAGSLGALVKALVDHPHWAHLRNLPIGTAFVGGGLVPPAPSTGEATASPIAAPRRAKAAPLRTAPTLASLPRLEAPAPPPSVESAIAASEAPAVPPVEIRPAPPPFGSVDDQAVIEVSDELSRRLGETDERALRDLRELAASWGPDAARVACRKALEIEAQGGMVNEGRRKTPGGVFFYLVKSRAGRALLGPEYEDLRPTTRRPQPLPMPSSPVAAAPTVLPQVVVRRPRAARVATVPAPAPAVERSKSNDLMNAMVIFIARNPGLREDEIRARLGGDRLLIRATLDALRAHRRVKTVGTGRAMTYTA